MAEPELAQDLFAENVLVALAPVDGVRDDLLPAEQAQCARFGEARLREFATGRRCARQLLAQLGCPELPLLRDPDGAPRWPPGVVGSISHKKERCLVAVASSREVAGLGVDLERAEPLAPALWGRICTPRERSWLEAQPEAEQGLLATTLFSAKESVYKAWFPLDRQRRVLQDIEIELDPRRGRFRVWAERGRELVEQPASGVYRRDRAWVITGMALPAPSPA